MSAPSITKLQPSMKESKPPETSLSPEHPVDVRLRRINDKILPTAPYMLSVDHSIDRNYVKQAYSHNANNWLKHTHFDRHEEKLQYLTFIDRSGDTSIYGMRVRGGWEDGKGGIAPPDEQVSRTSSDGTPGLGQAPKKKITLADYKNKDRNKALPTAPKPEMTEAKGAARANEKHVGQVAIVKEPSKPEKGEQQGQKRSADTITEVKDAHAFEHHPTTPPTKKARLSPEPSAVASRPSQDALPKALAHEEKSTAAKVEAHHVPSEKRRVENGSTQTTNEPTNTTHTSSKVPRAQKTAMLSLPPMLSPLASDIEEELAKLGPPARGRSHSAASTKAASVSPVVKSSKTNPASTPSSGEKTKPKNVVAKAASTPTKGPQEHKQITSAPRKGLEAVGAYKVAAAKATSKGLTNGNKDGEASGAKPNAPESSKKLRLRVTLKIKKRHRRTLMQYLRMKPTPGKYPWGMQSETRQETARQEPKLNSRATAHQAEDRASIKRTNSEAHKSGEKRRRVHDSEDEPEQPVKRQKAPGWVPQKAHTPKQSSISSPALSHLGSAQKPHLYAPEIEHRSTPMLRGPSGEGSVYTPHQPTASGTPNAPDTANSRQSVNISASSKPKSDDLRAEVKKYMALAKTLKYDADKFFKNPDGMTDGERKQAVIIGIESVLCFMLGFILGDANRQLGDRVGWNSILGYMVKVNHEARGFPHLTGLINQIEGVIRDVLVYTDLQRLDKNPLAEQFLNKVTEDPAKSEEQNKAAEYHRQFTELHNQSNQARKAWHTGLMHLNVTEIASNFPNTWAKREEHRAPFGKGLEAIKVGEYTRTFTIPMGYMTSGLEAVNFGLSVLAELCQKERVYWKPKLVL